MPYFIDYFISKISLGTLNCAYTPEIPLHSSSDPNILNVATARTKSYGQQTFAYQGPSNWNTVSGEVRRIEGMSAFRRKLKTSLFHQQDKDT